MRPNLLAYIKDSNINTEALCRSIGVSSGTFWNFTHGKTPMTAHAALSLRVALPDAPLEVRQELREGGGQCQRIATHRQTKGGVVDHWHARDGKTELAWGPKALCRMEN